MAEKRRFLDVWIVESNVVYREVPFAVVTDWVQQGRLLEDDMLRPSGTAEWFKLGGMAEFAPYLPRAEPHRPQDQAEALEPVAMDIAWKHRPDEEEDDPDMIPLIDVSLVLLIFFIMTTTGVAAASGILTPAAYYGGVKSIDTDLITIGVNCDDSREPTLYTLGLGDKPPEAEYEVRDNERAALRDEMRPPPAFLDMLDRRLASMEGPVEVVIKTNEELKDGYYVQLLRALEEPHRRVKVKKKYDGVREKTTP